MIIKRSMDVGAGQIILTASRTGGKIVAVTTQTFLSGSINLEGVMHLPDLNGERLPEVVLCIEKQEAATPSPCFTGGAEISFMAELANLTESAQKVLVF